MAAKFRRFKKTWLACAALAVLVTPASIAQEAGMDDFTAQREAIADALRDANPQGLGAILQSFVEVPFGERAFPGDLEDLGQGVKPTLDYRDLYQFGGKRSDANLDAVTRWYDAQIPTEFLAQMRKADRADDVVGILYLTRCRSGNLGEGVQLDLGDKPVSVLDPQAYEQARIAIALEREGDADLALPTLQMRQVRKGRAMPVPDSAIVAFNRRLLARAPDSPRLILEGFCGKLPFPSGYGGIVTTQALQTSSFYLLKFPAGVTSGKAAPLLLATICKNKTNSLVNTNCTGWESVASGVPQTGQGGKFRLVAKAGNAIKTYTYTVRPENLASGGQPPAVIPIPEGP